MQDPSALLAHEAAFALGQMGIASVVPALTRVLQDESLHPIVRHEVRPSREEQSLSTQDVGSARGVAESWGHVGPYRHPHCPLGL